MAQEIRDGRRTYRVREGLRMERPRAGGRDALRGREGVGWTAVDEATGKRFGWYLDLEEARDVGVVS